MLKRLATIVTIIAALSAAALSRAADALPAEDQSQRDQHMAWWGDARFGMFIHWGIYSVPAGYYNGQLVRQLPGEWIMFKEQIPLDTYARSLHWKIK